MKPQNQTDERIWREDVWPLANGTIVIEKDNCKTVRDAIATINHKERAGILKRIQDNPLEELTVSQLWQAERLEQSVVSQHLNRLRKFRVVSSRRAGKNFYYSILDAGLNAIEELCIKLTPGVKRVSKKKDLDLSVTYEKAYEVARVLNHKKRLEILWFLDREQVSAVKPIYTEFSWEQSQTSTDIKYLREIGVISYIREGKELIYKIEYKELERVVKLINKFAEALSPATNPA